MKDFNVRAARIRRFGLLAAVLVAIVLAIGNTGISFVISFAVLRDLAHQGMIPPDKAHLFPLGVDGAIITATIGTWVLSKINGEGKEKDHPLGVDGATIGTWVLSKISGAGKGKAFFVWLLFVSVGISLVGNGYHAYKAAQAALQAVAAGVDVGTTPLMPTAAAVIAVIPPLLVLAFTHGIGILIRGIGDANREYKAALAAATQDSVAYDEMYEGAPSPEFEESIGEPEPLLWNEDDIHRPVGVVYEPEHYTVADTEIPVSAAYEPQWHAEVTPEPVAQAAPVQVTPVEVAPVQVAPAEVAPAEDGPEQTVAALLAFLDGANIHAADKETARLLIEDPSRTFEYLAKATGAKSADMALRRYKRFERAAKAEGFTVPPLPVVTRTPVDLEVAPAAA